MLLQMLLLMIRLLRATWNITVNTVMKIIFVVSIMEMVLMVVKIPRRTHNVRMTAQLYDIIHKVWIPLLSHRSRQAEKRPSSGGRLVIWLFKVWKWCWLEKKSMVKNFHSFVLITFRTMIMERLYNFLPWSWRSTNKSVWNSSDPRGTSGEQENDVLKCVLKWIQHP